MNNYETIFNQRGKSYHHAMEKTGLARAAEFQALSNRLKQTPGNVILDLPAGGGYLEKYLSDDISYLPFDFSGEFNHGHTGIQKCKESKIELYSGTVDEIVTLAALHHIEKRREFYAEMFRILKSNGQLIIGDVMANSTVDHFLNGFVDKWNSMGHKGLFISEHDIDELSHAGFSVILEKESYYWDFAHKAQALEFFRLLFFLDMNPPSEQLENALENLGVSTLRGYSVKWEMAFLICKK